jgi:hypothetical protein
VDSHTVPKSLIRQKKECRQYHKVDGTDDTNSQKAILEFAVMEENSDVDEMQDA